jgi:RAB protein geranylgeranyltransferase component A
MISTTVETEEPESEIKVALDLLGPTLEMFVNVS